MFLNVLSNQLILETDVHYVVLKYRCFIESISSCINMWLGYIIINRILITSICTVLTTQRREVILLPITGVIVKFSFRLEAGHRRQVIVSGVGTITKGSVVIVAVRRCTRASEERFVPLDVRVNINTSVTGISCDGCRVDRTR